MDQEVRQLLERAVAAIERHAEVEQRRLQAAEEANRLQERAVVQQEMNGEAYRLRMANFRKQQRWALVVLLVMFLALIGLLAVLPSGPHR